MQTIATYYPILMVEVHYLGEAFVDFFERNLLPLGYQASTYRRPSATARSVGSIPCLTRSQRITGEGCGRRILRPSMPLNGVEKLGQA